jgi:hypothetical protein
MTSAVLVHRWRGPISAGDVTGAVVNHHPPITIVAALLLPETMVA